MNWLDRLLMLLEILILLKMLKMDSLNSQAIQAFLKERTLWYQRRAHLKTIPSQAAEAPSAQTIAAEALLENENPPATELGGELLTVLQESENEQQES
jgi:hypothetical protein